MYLKLSSLEVLNNSITQAGRLTGHLRILFQSVISNNILMKFEIAIILKILLLNVIPMHMLIVMARTENWIWDTYLT